MISLISQDIAVKTGVCSGILKELNVYEKEI